MGISIFCLICSAIFFFALGAFMSFVIFKLRKIDSQTDSIPKPNYYWSMGIYMNDIPQNDQNTPNLSSIPLKIYKKGKYSELLVPHNGEEVSGVYYSGENEFEMTGVVTRVFYNTDMDFIVVDCKCIDIRKINKI